MKRVNLLAILAISFSLTSFVACTSEEFTGTDAALSATALDEAQVSTINDDVVSNVDDYVNDIDASGYMAVNSFESSNPLRVGITKNINGVIITVDKSGNVYPKNICVDFGTTGITGKRGNILKGKIYITVSAKMTVANSTRTITLSDFFVNDNAVAGVKTVTYNGESNGKPSWTMAASDTITRADGTKVIWNSNRTRTRTANNDTPLIYWDDIYSITGTSNGINAKGVAYTMEIDPAKPLIIDGGFKYFVSGAVLTTSDKRTALLDYGDGTKDAKATVTINGVTKTINLRK